MNRLLAVLAVVALAVAGWWWFTREQPRREAEARRRAEVELARAEEAASLYRWRDEDGVLQITERPPRHRRYERIGRAPRDGIEVDAGRDGD